MTNLPDENSKVVDSSEIEMTTTYSFLRSKTFWSIVFMFLYNGYAAISGQLPADVTVIVNAIVGMLATYFHVSGVNSAALASAGGAPKSGQ